MDGTNVLGMPLDIIGMLHLSTKRILYEFLNILCIYMDHISMFYIILISFYALPEFDRI